MKRLYLDTAKVTFMVTRPAEEKGDGSGNQKRTKDGAPMWTVELLAQQEEGGVVINVTVAGDKPKVTSGQVVTLDDLEVIPWNNNGRYGNAFRATAIRQVAAAKAA
jgi:hypothetical protein